MSLDTTIQTTQHSSYWERNKGYILNAATVGAGTFASAVAHRLLGSSTHGDGIIDQTTIGSKANADGASLVINYVGANATNHGVKGNIRMVGSKVKQFGAIAAYTLGSLAADAVVGAVTKTPLFGPTSVIAATNAFSHLSKIACCKIAGLKTHLYGNEETETPVSETTGKRALMALAFAGSAAAGAAGLYFGAGNSVSALVYNCLSNVLRKTNKTALQLTEEPSARKRVVCVLTGLAIAGGVVAGLASPMSSLDGMSDVEKTWAYANQYFGAPTAIALTGLLTDSLSRAKRAWKPIGAHEAALYNPKKTKKTFGLFSGLVAAAAAVNGINGTFFGSKTVALGSKLWQQGLSFHSLRESLKGTSGRLKAAILTAAAATAIGIQAISNSLVNDGTGAWPMTAMAVGLGTVTAFGAKWIRNTLMPKPVAHEPGEVVMEPTTGTPSGEDTHHTRSSNTDQPVAVTVDG